MIEAPEDLTRDVEVETTKIEKHLANLQRGGAEGGPALLTRAALWNVVAHTTNPKQQKLAAETLARTSAKVPQRTIVVCADPAGGPALTSYVSANFLPHGSGREIYSEEVSIVAGGDRIPRVPPLVHSLLIPDMPVGVWWLGDLPAERQEYVQSLLGPADRLIVNSVHFNSPDDLVLMNRIAEDTFTSPADLNWVRLEEWRMATATVFDPPSLRARLRSVRKVRVVSGVSEETYFGQRSGALLFTSWLSAQLDHHVDSHGHVEGPQGDIEYAFECRRQSNDIGCVAFVELRFDDGSTASIRRDRDRGVLLANVDGTESVPESITRAFACEVPDLIARQLKRQQPDPVYLKSLPIASRLAKRVN